MLSGDNGILSRAGQVRNDTVVGQEKEQVELAYISAAVKKLGNDVADEELQLELNSSVGSGKTTVSTNDDNTLNVLFNETNHNYNVDNGKVSKIDSDNLNKIRDAYVSSEGQLIVLKGTGELCKSGYTSRNGDWVKYDSENEVKIAENVKEFNSDYYYITNSNTLYLFDGTKIAENVKKVYPSFYLYYLTNNNELYNYNLNEKISDNVLKFVPGNYYLKFNKELYEQDGTKVSNNVKEICGGDYYYITEDNSLYNNKRKNTR